jgi:hypothetical protein
VPAVSDWISVASSGEVSLVCRADPLPGSGGRGPGAGPANRERTVANGNEEEREDQGLTTAANNPRTDSDGGRAKEEGAAGGPAEA